MRRGINNVIGAAILVAMAIALGAYLACYVGLLRPQSTPKITLVNANFYYNYTYFAIKIEWDRPFTVTLESGNASTSSVVICLNGCSGSGHQVTAYCQNGDCRYEVNVIYARSIIVVVADQHGNSYSEVLSVAPTP